MNYNPEQLRQIQEDPVGMGKKMRGYDIPTNLANDPEAMVRHLIMTGQVGGPLLQKVMPMILKMGK